MCIIIGRCTVVYMLDDSKLISPIPHAYYFVQYGGDVTRRMKLLKQQSDGKKKMRSMANIRVPHDTFVKVLRR